MKKIIAVTLIVCLFLSGCGVTADEKKEASVPVREVMLSRDEYTLQQVVVLSRHNIRSPLSGKGSVLDTITPHEWFSWTSDPSELSLKGGVLETEMGQFFRRWLEDEGLFPENYQPSPGEVRIYSNSKQRTIATANYFLTGLLPLSDMDVEFHMDLDEMDPVFNPQLTFMSEEYREEAEDQIRSMFDGRIQSLSDNCKLLGDVIDIKDSEGWKNGDFTGFRTDDMELVLEEGAEPGMTGSLKTACSVSDALVLQYYEGDDEVAAFGKKLTDKQWEDIAEIKDTYQEILFTAPLIAVNVAHPLLKEINAELHEENRKFTFLCGHDSNLSSVLAALSAEEYDLPDSIEKTAPIGSKLVFCKWKDGNGKQYISIDMVYQNTEQLRGLSLLDVDNPPAITHIYLDGISPNKDGMYEYEKAEERIAQAIGDSEEAAPDIDITGCDTFTQIIDKKLSDGMGYANETVDRTDVFLVSSGTYDNLDGKMAAIDATVFVYKDGTPVEIGKVESGGTAYPLAIKDGKLYTGGNHFVCKYALSDDKLVVMEKAAVSYDSEGNETYSYDSDDGGDYSGLDSTEAEKIFDDLLGEMGSAEVIGFSTVGGDGVSEK